MQSGSNKIKAQIKLDGRAHTVYISSQRAGQIKGLQKLIKQNQNKK